MQNDESADFENGPKTNALWLPSRIVTDLRTFEDNLETPSLPRLFVDNYWHLYHEPIEAQNWTDREAEVFGKIGSKITAVARAPSLPTCLPLTADQQFSHSIQDSVASFAPYDLGNLVINGGDDDYLQALNRGEAGGVEGPFPRVPALLWHRVAFEDFASGRELLQCSLNDSARCQSRYVRMTDEGRAAFCRSKGEYSADLEPEAACDGSRRQPAVTYPYCTKESAPAAVLSVDCLFSESSYAHSDIIWNLVSLSAGGRSLSNNGPGRWQVMRGVPISDYDELAVAGTAVYPGAPGHFFNEILPRLVHLDVVLPAHIPLLWPDGGIPERILHAFRAAGILSRARTFVPTAAPRMHRARRMYTYSSEFVASHTPVIVLLSQVVLQARVHRYLAERGAAPHGGIVVLTRGQDGKARSVVNQEELLGALRAAWPDLTVDAFEPSGDVPFLDAAMRVHRGRVVMGPHGANLNNVLGARPGTTMIEFGCVGAPVRALGV